MPRLRLVALLSAALSLAGCSKEDDGGGGPVVNRCEADLSALGLSAGDGSGSQAVLIDEDGELIGGQWAQAQHGDTLLRNDRIRVVIQQPSRHIGPNPYGGNLIDADIVRADGSGKDQFGKMALLYAFGRTTIARHVEILRDGEGGGSAVVAVTGDDTVNDFLNVQNMIGRLIGGNTKFVIDPEAPVPARITTYYVLNPGESRVRMLTAFCNDTDSRIIAPVGDLVDRGGSVEYFNPLSCEGSMGSSNSCFVEKAPWFGWQGEAAAYGVRNYRTEDPSQPDPVSAVLTVAGMSASMAGGEGMDGMLAWLDASASRRPGTFIIPAKQSKTFLRDFYVGRDLGEVAGHINGGVPVSVTVTTAAGAPVQNARVAFIGADGKLITVATTDASGKGATNLPDPSSVSVQAELSGYAPSETVTLSTCGTSTCTLKLGGTRRLTVNVKDPFDAPSPAKLTVLCTGLKGCSPSTRSLKRFHDHEVLPDNVAFIGFVPPQGALEVQLPPATYEVVLTRGPEYSAWPSTWPASGEAVDLTSADQSVNAVLARVVDTKGWMSADLHVHSVNSPDSALRNETRVVNFAAEGVDVLCSTDHDFITDFAPHVRSTGSEHVLASMIGLEVTPFDWGHYNVFPITTSATPSGGAFDWAGGEGATLRQGQMIDGVREIWGDSTVVQLNHPRGPLGSLTLMRVDTPTLSTHSPASAFRMDAAPDATDTDSRLFTASWDAIEIMNDSKVEEAHKVLNDWFTFLSRGIVRTGTATSDTHYALAYQGGYPRTFVDMDGRDAIAQFDTSVFSANLRRQRALGTNGPFMKVSARKVAGGLPTGESVGMGGTLRISTGEQVELTVDVQAPEWMYFDTLEVFTHAAGREAYDGVENNSWPTDRIHQSRTLNLGGTALEPLVINSQTFRRHHLTEKFTLSPATDSWFVVTLRSNGNQTLFPMHFQGVGCSGGACTAVDAKPFAFSNPILIDADGNGYDKYPLSVPPPPPPVNRSSTEPLPLSEAELIQALHKLAGAH